VKSRMVRLSTRVETLKEVLQKYLDDDADMKDLNLSAKCARSCGGRVKAHVWVAIEQTGKQQHMADALPARCRGSGNASGGRKWSATRGVVCDSGFLGAFRQKFMLNCTLSSSGSRRRCRGRTRCSGGRWTHR